MAMTLRTSPDDDRRIEELARTLGVSKHEAVLRAVLAASDRTVKRERVEQSAERLTARYGDLLRRLGE
ncbi:CopG family transcriptional regulator [Microbacterium sp. A93]|uniref:CopG family transcriptional regulator n=1 Tax=Microbacterium sp. A93 TaxID=3450716 RepID=UPI003F432B1A